MAKAIYFDMDGTLAELYEVENWLPKLRAENPEPYIVAKPKINMEELVASLNFFKEEGYTIGIISWLSMNSTKEYAKAVRKAKLEWLANNINFEFDEIHLVKYGAAKHRVAKVRKGILVDDNEKVREDWERYGGATINAEPKDWLINFG